jgi:hypothetical protein
LIWINSLKTTGHAAVFALQLIPQELPSESLTEKSSEIKVEKVCFTASDAT